MVNHALLHCMVAVVVFWLACPTNSLGQVTADTTASGDIQDAIEALLQNTEAEDAEHLIDELLVLYDAPINLSTAGAIAISRLPGITRLQANRFVRYRAATSDAVSPDEVREALSVSQGQFKALRPFIILPHEAEAREDSTAWTNVLNGKWTWEWIQRYTRQLELPRGFQKEDGEPAYHGSPDRLYVRLRATSEHAKLNLTLDKAPGEPFTWDPNREAMAFPHQSVYMQLREIGRLRSLVVGDFDIGFGQGLTLWPTRLGGTSRDPFTSILSTSRGLSPFGSSMRNEGFRGIASTISVSKSIDASLFASNVRRDATVDTLRHQEGTRIQSPGPSAGGYYRTTSEIARKAQLPERMIGGAIEYYHNGISFGATAYRSQFGAVITPDDAPHRAHQFAGTDAFVVGTFGRWSGQVNEVFGEVARAPSGAIGAVAGAHMELGRNASLVTAARYLPASFDGLYGAAFTSVSGLPQNEYGWYTGLRLHLHHAWIVDAYIDHHQFPWLRHHFRQPTTGYDARLVIRHEPYRWLNSYLEFRQRSRDERTETTDGTGRELIGVTPEVRRSIRAQTTYQFSPIVRLQLHASAARVERGNVAPEHGFLLYSDVLLFPIEILRLNARLSFFDTDSYQSRMYAYESDLLYAFNLPALHRTGQRSHVMLTWQPSARWYLQLKYSNTRFQNVSSFGSGWGETEGNRQREIRAQLRIRY